MRSDERVIKGAVLKGAAAGLLPHAGLTFVIALSYQQNEGSSERAFAAMPAYLEILVLPAAALVILIMLFHQRFRGVAVGMLIGSMIGLLMITVAVDRVDRP